MSHDDFICPVCGAEVPGKAKACPECGADETTGWSANTIYDGTGIDDPDEFDYEDWRRRELGGGPRRSRREWVIWGVAALMLALFLWLMLR